jgi:hypothetical protein
VGVDCCTRGINEMNLLKKSFNKNDESSFGFEKG